MPAASAQAWRSWSLPSASKRVASIISLPIMSWYVIVVSFVVVIGTNAELGVFYDCTLEPGPTCSS
jgi:hypothetical protein